ncbi:MAG: hypothetical protein HY917_01625, partial [Candidatus Diapherotrites archaeon]|nr:hypothetical protein [Candidatus Diapherotrites archaeon]
IAGLELQKKETAKAIESVASGAVSRTIKKICEKPELQKNEIRELEDFCRVYAMRKALKQCGLMADYSEIEIPGMKKAKKSENVNGND